MLEFAKGPDALPLIGRLRVNDTANAMLHSVFPLAPVLASIRVGVHALTMLLIESIVTFVPAPVLPDIVAIAVHDASLELPLEVATISPLEATVSTHFVVLPRPRILRPVGPEVCALAFFDATEEIAVVVAAIAPHFDSFSILPILL